MEILLVESLEKLYLGQNKGIKLTSLPEDIIKLQVGTIGGGGGLYCGLALQLLPNVELKILLMSLGTWCSIRPGLSE